MEHRYGVLRIIATVYTVIGAIIAVIAVLVALLACIGGAAFSSFSGSNGLPNTGSGAVGGIFAGIVILIFGIIYALIFYGLGEGISVFLALEENTRITATLLQQNLRALASPTSSTLPPTSSPPLPPP